MGAAGTLPGSTAAGRAAAAVSARQGGRLGLHDAADALALLDRRLGLPRGARRRAGRRRRRRPCRGRRGGGRARRPALSARRRDQPGRPGHRPGHHGRLLQARSHPRHRSRAARGDGGAGRDPGVAQPRRGGVRPRVRARHLHRGPGDDRRDGRQQLVGLALDRLRRDGGQGAGHRRRPGRRGGGQVRSLRGAGPGLRCRRLRRGAAGAGARGDPRPLARAHRHRVSAHLALHLGLQPARAAGAAAEPRSPAGRLGRHAGAVHPARGAARPAAGAAGGRRAHVRHAARAPSRPTSPSSPADRRRWSCWTSTRCAGLPT